MVWIYEMELSVVPISEPDNVETYTSSLLKCLYADYKIKEIKRKDNRINIDYIFRAGNEIKNHKGTTRFLIGEKVKDFEIKEKSMMGKSSPNYFEHTAKRLSSGKEPMTYKEFNKEREQREKDHFNNQ